MGILTDQGVEAMTQNVVNENVDTSVITVSQQEAKQQNLLREILINNPGARPERVQEGLTLVEKCNQAYLRKERQAYIGAKYAVAFRDGEFYKDLGFKSMNDFLTSPPEVVEETTEGVSGQNGGMIASKSQVYKWFRAEDFMTEIGANNPDWVDTITGVHGATKQIVKDANGDVNQRETRVANSIERRLPMQYTDEVARAFGSQNVTRTQALDLLAEGMNGLRVEDIPNKIREMRGEEAILTPREKLIDAGVVPGYYAVAELGSHSDMNETRERKTRDNITSLMTSLDEGDMTAVLKEISDGNYDEIAKVSTVYVKTRGTGTILAIIK